MMRKLGILFTILLTIFFIYVLAKNIIVRVTLEKLVETALGVKVKVDDFDVSFLGHHLRAEGITIENPSGFKNGEFAYINTVNIICNPFDYITDRKITIYFLGVDIDKINIIKDENGDVNLKDFKILHRTDEGQPHFRVDIFQLSLKDVYYIDYSRPSSPRVKQYKIDMKNYAFENINSFEDVTHIVVWKALANTGIGKAINYTVAPLANNVKDVVFVGTRTTGSIIKGIFSLPSLFKRNNNNN